MFTSDNQLHVYGFYDLVNLLGSAPGTALHMRYIALRFESCET